MHALESQSAFLHRGGNIAWHLAATQPQLISKLVILATPHPKAYEDKACMTSEQQKRQALYLQFALSAWWSLQGCVHAACVCLSPA